MGPDRGHLEQLPPTARSQLLATVASFLPYYCDPKVSPVAFVIMMTSIVICITVEVSCCGGLPPALLLLHV
jgi:multisubunit Na+/H+ antiporter MnhC subunit